MDELIEEFGEKNVYTMLDKFRMIYPFGSESEFWVFAEGYRQGWFIGTEAGIGTGISLVNKHGN